MYSKQACEHHQDTSTLWFVYVHIINDVTLKVPHYLKEEVSAGWQAWVAIQLCPSIIYMGVGPCGPSPAPFKSTKSTTLSPQRITITVAATWYKVLKIILNVSELTEY